LQTRGHRDPAHPVHPHAHSGHIAEHSRTRGLCLPEALAPLPEQAITQGRVGSTVSDLANLLAVVFDDENATAPAELAEAINEELDVLVL
jgi:urease gamma subunit